MAGGQNTLQLQQKCSALSEGFSKRPGCCRKIQKGAMGLSPQQCNICLDFRHCSLQSKPKVRYLLQETRDTLGH